MKRGNHITRAKCCQPSQFDDKALNVNRCGDSSCIIDAMSREVIESVHVLVAAA